jgi:hypothetical protein
VARHLEILTEELSAARVVEELFEHHLPDTTTYNVIQFNGLENLLDRLPERLAGYRSWISDEWRIVVLVDRDRADCHQRKDLIETMAQDAGFYTKTDPAPDGTFQVVTRIAVEELEAWFFGDVPALSVAYPGVPATLDQKHEYRDADAVRGGTAEALLRVLQEAGHYKGLSRPPKLEIAERVATRMRPDSNTSRSFRVFWDTIIRL